MTLTASIGLAAYPSHGKAAAEIVERAVARMFDARQDSGNRIYEAT
jgi:GGDEF domain-containing protein